MFMRKVKGGWGFTLIELLAVMAIVAVLASIVSVAVTGSGQDSRDTQVREDSNSAGSTITNFFDDQPVTELFDEITVDVKTKSKTFTGITEKTSRKWPEAFVTDFYPQTFIVIKEGTTVFTPTETVNRIDFLDAEGGGAVSIDEAVPAVITANTAYSEWTVARGGDLIVLNAADRDQTIDIDDVTHFFELDANNTVVTVTLGAFASGSPTSTLEEAHILEADDLIVDFTAIDWDILEDEGYTTTIPESLNDLSEIDSSTFYSSYLWLLEKDLERDARGTITSRNVVVFLLVSVTPSTVNAGTFDLVYQRVA